MALWWLYGGYVFQIVVKLKILTFYIRFDLEGQGQSSYKITGILTHVFCTSGLHLVILVWMGEELLSGQAQTGVHLEFHLIFIPPPNEVGGGVYWIHLVRPSVRLSVRLSVDDMVSGA